MKKDIRETEMPDISERLAAEKAARQQAEEQRQEQAAAASTAQAEKEAVINEINILINKIEEDTPERLKLSTWVDIFITQLKFSQVRIRCSAGNLAEESESAAYLIEEWARFVTEGDSFSLRQPALATTNRGIRSTYAGIKRQMSALPDPHAEGGGGGGGGGASVAAADAVADDSSDDDAIGEARAVMGPVEREVAKLREEVDGRLESMQAKYYDLISQGVSNAYPNLTLSMRKRVFRHGIMCQLEFCMQRVGQSPASIEKEKPLIAYLLGLSAALRKKGNRGVIEFLSKVKLDEVKKIGVMQEIGRIYRRVSMQENAARRDTNLLVHGSGNSEDVAPGADADPNSPGAN